MTILNSTQLSRRGAVGRERGAALLVVLILLILITLIGLATIRGTILQERMSSNQYDRSLSFQAAEEALVAGEKSTVTAACDVASCPLNPTAWTGSAAEWTKATANNTIAADGVMPAAAYLVERLGVNAGGYPVYRVTARSSEDGRAAVTLQSTFTSPKK